MTTAALQHRLAAAIRDGADATGLLAGDFTRGLQAYRHAYAARLLAALNDNFTVLARALGDEGFDALGRAYLAARPSQHPSIRWFGHELAEFMAESVAEGADRDGDALVPHASLVDLARMDWALRGAFDAADAPVLTREALQALPADGWASLVLHLQPSARCVPLAHAVEPAWRALREWEPDAGGDAPAVPEPVPHAHGLLAWRAQGDTRWRSLEPLEAALLQRVACGDAWPALCEVAAVELGSADAAAPAVVGLLQRWLEDGLLRAAPAPAPGSRAP